MLDRNPKAWAMLVMLSVASAAGIGSIAQQSRPRPKVTLPTTDTQVTSYPRGKAPWDRRWVEVGALPSGKIGVIAHQDGQPPLEIIFETTKDQGLRAVRFAMNDRGELIKQPLQGKGLRVWMADNKTDVMVSVLPIKMADIEKIPSP